MAKKILNKMFGVRTNEEDLSEFKEYCDKHLKIEPSELVREMMSAVVDGRLRMKKGNQPENAMEQLYYVD